MISEQGTLFFMKVDIINVGYKDPWGCFQPNGEASLGSLLTGGKYLAQGSRKSKEL